MRICSGIENLTLGGVESTIKVNVAFALFPDVSFATMVMLYFPEDKVVVGM